MGEGMKQFIYTGELKKIYPDAMLDTGLITKSEYNAICAYLRFTDVIITYECNKGFVVSTPQQTIIFSNKADFMQDINYNLECIKECYHDRDVDGDRSEYDY